MSGRFLIMVKPGVGGRLAYEIHDLQRQGSPVVAGPMDAFDVHDLARTLETHLELIRHIQIADPPLRSEPGRPLMGIGSVPPVVPEVPVPTSASNIASALIEVGFIDRRSGDRLQRLPAGDQLVHGRAISLGLQPLAHLLAAGYAVEFASPGGRPPQVDAQSVKFLAADARDLSTQMRLALATCARIGAADAIEPLAVTRVVAAVAAALVAGRISDTGLPSTRKPPGL